MCDQVRSDSPQIPRDIRDTWPDPMGQWTAEQAESARAMKAMIIERLAGRAVIEPPPPDAHEDPMGRTKEIWNTGPFSVAATTTRAIVKDGRDGLGGGIAFTSENAREVAAALIAAADYVDRAASGFSENGDTQTGGGS